MRQFVRYTLALLIVLAGVKTNAQEAQKEMRLTLSECVEVAVTNNASIEQNKYTVALAEAGVDSRRHQFLPSTSMSWSISRNIQGPREGATLDQTTGEIVQTLGESRTSGGQSFGFGSLSIPIYNGQLLSQLAASKKSLKEAEFDGQATHSQVVFQVKQNYFQLLQAMRLLEVQQERVRVSEESLRRAETLYEIGSAAILQVANARSNLANLNAQLIQRENAVDIARSNLAFNMGLGTDVDIIPAEEEFELLPPKFSYHDALNIALEQHPSLQADRYGMLEARDTYTSVQRSLYHPLITATAGYGWSIGQDEDFAGPEDLFLKNYSYSFSVRAQMNILNMGTTNTLKTQRLQYLRSQELLDQAKRQKALNVKQRYLNLAQFRRSIEATEVAVQAAEENFKLEEERYNFGGGTFLERLTAQRDLFDARNNLVQAQYNYLIEMARLENEVGVPVLGNSE